MRIRPSSAGRCLVLLALLCSGGATVAAGRVGQTLDFAVEMARKGNWREARFRWEQAASSLPNDPRILNNLGVASEILGDPEAADGYYRRARELAPRSATIAENLARFQALQDESGQDDDQPLDQDVDLSIVGKKPPRGSFRVSARFRLPPRLDVSKYESLLVASFKPEESDLLDVNRELTRYLRRQITKDSSLTVREVVPPPAIPEQTIDDLIANAEFWRHLGREYDADLVVSGVVNFSRRETSGFRNVDTISRTTGQKVRETRFVEEEEFTHSLQILFMDGRTGELLYRDRIERTARFPGTTNDALTVFYGLVEAIARDVLAVVSPRMREDVRLVFDS